ncbi:hypothetical protein KA977_09430 [Candidatus Dependentiae bacterium]|nr:hypothetical protein [Candidatus Dependentiae bacterium]
MKKMFLFLLFLLFFVSKNYCGAADVLTDSDIIPVTKHNYLDVLFNEIKNSKSSIKIVHFEFNNDKVIFKIVDALNKAAARGVKINILCESELRDKSEKTFEKINKNLKINFKFDMEARKTHCKMYIFDNKKVMLGSTNLSYKSILHNNETNVLFKNEKLALYYSEYFDKLWDDSSKDPELNLVKLENAEPIVNRNYFPRVLKLISDSNKYINLYMYGLRISDAKSSNSPINKLLNALISAEARGVKVRVMMEQSDYNDLINKYNYEVAEYLKENKIEVRFDPLKEITHAKLLIVDDIVVLGSTNWGYGAMMQYNEANLLVKTDITASFFNDYFEKLWKLNNKKLKYKNN